MNKEALSKIARQCLDLIFPRYCLGCRAEGSYLCPKCFASLAVRQHFNCFFCGRRSPQGRLCADCRHRYHPPLAGILVAADWENLLLRQIIYEYKYRFVKELADPLTGLLKTFLENNRVLEQVLNCSKNDLAIIPVPLHGRRLAWRGFNQAEILARRIGLGRELTDLLVRTRHTLPQMGLADPAARKANIAEAFALPSKIDPKNNSPLKNKIVILVDDVSTTGATLRDCARALKPLRPKEIWGLVIARG